MTTAYCFDETRAQKACDHYIGTGPRWTRWLRRIATWGFMQILRANPTGKLAVVAAPPTVTPGLRPKPAPLPDVEDARDG